MNKVRGKRKNIVKTRKLPFSGGRSASHRHTAAPVRQAQKIRRAGPPFCPKCRIFRRARDAVCETCEGYKKCGKSAPFYPAAGHDPLVKSAQKKKGFSLRMRVCCSQKIYKI